MLFTVITVTRNNLSGLQNTATSLSEQVFRDFEWIVVDGASTDGTTEFLKSTPAEWVSEPDRGIYDAMNKGIERARGDYVLFLNAGDILAGPAVLADIDMMLEDEDFIYGDSIESNHLKKARSHRRITTSMITHHQSMLYKRSAIGSLRYDTDYKIAADYKFTASFLRTARPLYCPFPICVFEPGGLSQQQATLGRKEQFQARKDLKICSFAANTAIYSLQTLLMTLRQTVPGLYWLLKKSR